MLTTLLALAAALPPPATALLDPLPPPAITQSSTDELQDLIDEYDDAQDAYYERSRAATAETREEVRKTRPDPADYVPRFRELATKYAGSAAAVQAWVWIHGNSRDQEVKTEAFTVLRQEYINSEHIASFCRSLGRVDGENEQFLLEALEVNEHPAVQGASCFALGKLYQSMAGLATRLKEMNEEDRERFISRYGEPHVARLADAKALQARAEQFFRRVVADYPDLEYYRGTLGEAAEAYLFEMQYLQIGKVAPDIEGEDLDGVTFKLSDYRGKVVVIDFWGNW